jgi:hypothetical protein
MTDEVAAARETQLADLLLFCPFVASSLESDTLLDLSDAILVRPRRTVVISYTPYIPVLRYPPHGTRTHDTRTRGTTHAQEEQMGYARGEGDAARLRPESHLGRGPLDVAHRE